MTSPDPHCKWCAQRRGALPGGVLICVACDYDHAWATVIPNEHKIRDVPK